MKCITWWTSAIHQAQAEKINSSLPRHLRHTKKEKKRQLMVSSFQDYWKDKGKKTPRENSEAVETTSPEITCKPDNTTSEQQHQSEWRHEFQRSRTTVTPLHKSQGRKQCTGCDYNRRFHRQVVRGLSSYLNTEWNQLMMHFQIIVVTSPWSADAKRHGTNRDFF